MRATIREFPSLRHASPGPGPAGLRAAALLAGVAVFAFAGDSAAALRGRVLDSAGNVPAMAHAHLTGVQGDPAQSYSVAAADSLGRFLVDSPPAGYYRLVIVAPNHDYASLPFALAPGESLDAEFEIRLAPVRLPGELSGLKATGSWNAFLSPTAVPMTPGPDGAWSCVVKAEADTVAYQVLNAAGERQPLPGTSADHYLYDRRGNYLSVLRLAARGDSARLVFDAAALRRLEREDLPRFSIVAGAGGLAAMWEMDRALIAGTRRHNAAAGRADPGWGPALETLGRNLEAGGDAGVQGYAAMKLKALESRGVAVPDELSRLAERTLTPESTAWRWEIAALAESGSGLPADRGARERLLRTMSVDNPDPLLRALALVQLGTMADEAGDEAMLVSIHERMKTELSEIPGIERYLANLDPARRVRPGRTAPPFSVELLDGGGTVTDAEFRGRYLLLDFWATWCGPCLAEMETLHAVHERFAGPKFEILSLSFDRAAGDVAAFRGRKWPLPWKNAYVQGGFQNALAKAYEVSGIPKPVLLGPDGRIVAVGSSLRGPRLFTTLETSLGGAP